MIVLVVIVGFPLFGPPRENGGYTFRADPVLSSLTEYFLHLFIQIIEIIKKTNLMFFAPWQETFADAGDGDWGGTI